MDLDQVRCERCLKLFMLDGGPGADGYLLCGECLDVLTVIGLETPVRSWRGRRRPQPRWGRLPAIGGEQVDALDQLEPIGSGAAS